LYALSEAAGGPRLHGEVSRGVPQAWSVPPRSAGLVHGDRGVLPSTPCGARRQAELSTSERFPRGYLMKAMLGHAWAVADVMAAVYHGEVGGAGRSTAWLTGSSAAPLLNRCSRQGVQDLHYGAQGATVPCLALG